MSQLTVENVLSQLEKAPGAAALLEPDGVFLVEAGRVRRISPAPATGLIPESSGRLTSMAILDEMDKNGGACDVSYPWKSNYMVANTLRMVRGKITNEIRLFPSEPPAAEAIGLAKVLDSGLLEEGGIVVVYGERRSGRKTAAYSMMMEALPGRFGVTLEDPIIYNPKVPEHSVLARREVGLADGDVPSFLQGVRQAAEQKPHMLLVDRIPDGETIRALVEVASEGATVLACCFGLSPEDTIRRLSVSEAECMSRASSYGYTEALLASIKLMVGMGKRVEGSSNGMPQIISGNGLKIVKESLRQE